MGGTIIYLNGTSSAGKTTLSKQLLDVLPEKYYYLSLDQYNHQIGNMFAGLLGLDPKNKDIDYAKGKRLLSRPSMELMYQAIQVMSELGMNVIVDDVLINKLWLNRCVELLADHPVYFIKVNCPIEELERRERSRGDRTIGKARSQYDTIHHHGKYDLEVNTYESSIMVCAEHIIKYIYKDRSEPRAFKELQRIREEAIIPLKGENL
ncbi:chemotaxis protein [Paenibacillus hemerocallicola]|uniref:Chemotaxis protein n=1 Tax=Paenibacillus hemerocallicola TaxID=1172614 RepID=A0A5C4TI09_9BACL|nr:AAA family ATPase [Paenibacillus hemerocallicola]TNJ68110.1 chemotaxis protein [Paenibacillus hemerocallicola]